MQENHENENTESVEITTPEPQVSKKLYKRPKFLVGVAITLVIYGVAIASQNTIAMWMFFVVPFIIGIALMFNKKSQDIGMGIFGGMIIPLLLMMLLVGACMIGIEGFSLFN